MIKEMKEEVGKVEKMFYEQNGNTNKVIEILKGN
jgi:hypothetical protein